MISVIIPCFNSAVFAGRAIKSVFHQTYSNWEIILVNNNSTDDTQQVLEQYQQQKPEQIKIFQESKKGSAYARNKGLQEARGEWIQYLDADDELWPHKFEQQIKLVHEQKCDIIAGSFIKKIPDRNGIREDKRMSKADNVWHGLIASDLGITSANLWKKKALDAVQGWNTTLTSSQEYDLLFRLMKNGGSVCCDKEITVTIHTPHNSISRDSKPERTQEIISNWLLLRLHIKEYLVSKGLFTESTRAFFDEFVYYKFSLYKGVTSAAFINDLLRPLQLKVPVGKKLRANYKHYEASLRKFKRKYLH